MKSKKSLIRLLRFLSSHTPEEATAFLHNQELRLPKVLDLMQFPRIKDPKLSSPKSK